MGRVPITGGATGPGAAPRMRLRALAGVRALQRSERLMRRRLQRPGAPNPKPYVSTHAPGSPKFPPPPAVRRTETGHE